MRDFISERIAGVSLTILFSLVLVFHLLIVVRIIPYGIVWGGRLTNASEMYAYEAVSIVVNIIMLAIVAVRGGYVKSSLSQKPVRIALWVMAGLFFLNTVSNIFSVNETERLVFTPLTLMSSILCYRLSIGDKTNDQVEVKH